LIQKTDSIEIAAGWIISYFALGDSNAPIGPNISYYNVLRQKVVVKLREIFR